MISVRVRVRGKVRVGGVGVRVRVRPAGLGGVSLHGSAHVSMVARIEFFKSSKRM